MKRPNTLWVSLACGAIMLALLLTACSPGGGNAAASTPSPSAASTTSPTPSSPPAPSLALYQNQGYTVSYPHSWQLKAVHLWSTFFEAQRIHPFAIEPMADPDNGAPPGLAQEALASTISQWEATAQNTKELPLAPTVTIHGVTWDQRPVGGDVANQGIAVNTTVIVLATHNPAQQLTYVLVYSAPTAQFAASNSAYFQPMVQLLTFAPALSPWAKIIARCAKARPHWYWPPSTMWC